MVWGKILGSILPMNRKNYLCSMQVKVALFLLMAFSRKLRGVRRTIENIISLLKWLGLLDPGMWLIHSWPRVKICRLPLRCPFLAKLLCSCVCIKNILSPLMFRGHTFFQMEMLLCAYLLYNHLLKRRCSVRNRNLGSEVLSLLLYYSFCDKVLTFS